MDALEKIMLEEANKFLNTNYLTHSELNQHQANKAQIEDVFGKVFDRFDIDEDGFLSFSDWQNTYINYGENFTVENFRRILEKCPDGQCVDDKISRDTFIQLLVVYG